MESYIQNLFAERIGGPSFGKDDTIYKFEKIKRAKRAAMSEHPDTPLIDLGVGEPDDMADSGVVESLCREAARPENRGYSDNGIEEFRAAAARYMENVFDVNGLDPEKEINHSIGSKPGLAMIPAAFINPGDVTLMTVPGYPVLGTHTGWYGGEVHPMPLTEEKGFLPALESVPSDILKRAKILLLNYPNNPTGAAATEEFYREVVDFAKRNELVVIQDAAYAALTYDSPPCSFLSVPGARDVGVEVHSLSKAFNMTGWRLAFVAGNELVVKAFASVKDNYDSGQFKAIQRAGIKALENPSITVATREKYQRRLSRLVEILKNCGFHAAMPGGTFYLYVSIPKSANGTEFGSAEEFSQFLIREKLISTVPWDDVGHYVRFSATFETGTAGEDAVLSEIESRLSGINFTF